MLLNNQFWVALCSSTIFDYLLTTQLFWSVSLDPRLDEIFKHCWGPPLRISSRRRSFAFGGANLKIHTLWALVRTKLDPFFQHESTQPHSPFVLYQGGSLLSSSLYDYSPCQAGNPWMPNLKTLPADRCSSSSALSCSFCLRRRSSFSFSRSSFFRAWRAEIRWKLQWSWQLQGSIIWNITPYKREYDKNPPVKKSDPAKSISNKWSRSVSGHQSPDSLVHLNFFEKKYLKLDL